MHGLMSGDWKRSTVSGPQRLQRERVDSAGPIDHRASPRLYPLVNLDTVVLRLAPPMDAQTLPVHEAAATTGWSARMLRYLERVGLVVPPRTAAGYRVYGAAEVQRLRTLRELLADHGIALSDVAFAKRLRDDP